MSANPVTAYNKVFDEENLTWVFATQAVIQGGEVNVSGPIAVTGPLTDAELRDEPVPVSGEFYPETQPVSGTVEVSNLPETQPVSGTVDVGNWPETQAVSLATAPTTPVTGTFWPETQPVSAVSLPLPSGAATSVNQATLESLIDTLQELAQRLAPLGSMASSGAVGLRVVGVTMPSTAVTGPLTSAQFLTAQRGIENLIAIHSNINNVTTA